MIQNLRIRETESKIIIQNPRNIKNKKKMIQNLRIRETESKIIIQNPRNIKNKKK